MTDMPYPDLMRALYEEAGREPDAARAAQLKRDADTLKDVWDRLPYALAPSRDQMQRAIGNASLDIADTLTELAREMRSIREMVGDMHTHVQNNDTLVSAFIESFAPFQAEARAAWEGSAQQIKKLDARVGKVERTIRARPRQRRIEHKELLEGQIAIRDHVVALDERHTAQWTEVIARLATDEQRLDRKRDELDALHQWQSRIEDRLAELEAQRQANDGDGR